ncbi:invasion associated locus B family protein [Methylobacterium durans]|uniref:Invasion protein n=1 Tax=Methylobacterium durans TaxID=2202825 RepID=A0A2U8W9R0_9HYPH|nr:invasion associated locus B family protein [Methylobacterium durans]AWN42190.1 invasion protein [Methylobacterium durans]
MTQLRAIRSFVLIGGLALLPLAAAPGLAQEEAPAGESAAPAAKPKPKPQPRKPAPKPAEAAKPAEPAPTAAAGAATWPAGASAVSETYDNWTVNCSRENAATQCTMTQSQGDKKTGRRQFAIELKAPKDGRSDGLILMPFGVSIEPGVSFKLDETVLGKGAPYVACGSEGCLVPISFPTLATDTMKTAQNLTVTAQRPEGQEPTVITVPLAGFAAAFARVIAFGS